MFHLLIVNFLTKLWLGFEMQFDLTIFTSNLIFYYERYNNKDFKTD